MNYGHLNTGHLVAAKSSDISSFISFYIYYLNKNITLKTKTISDSKSPATVSTLCLSLQLQSGQKVPIVKNLMKLLY